MIFFHEKSLIIDEYRVVVGSKWKTKLSVVGKGERDSLMQIVVGDREHLGFQL